MNDIFKLIRVSFFFIQLVYIKNVDPGKSHEFTIIYVLPTKLYLNLTINNSQKLCMIYLNKRILVVFCFLQNFYFVFSSIPTERSFRVNQSLGVKVHTKRLVLRE